MQRLSKRFGLPLLALVIAATAVVAAISAAPPAYADTPGGWAYAMVDPVSRPAGDIPLSTTTMDSSINTPATARKSNVGFYEVTFPNLAVVAPMGIIHVTPATEGRYCYASYGERTGNIVVTVTCASLTQSYADSAFTVLYTSAPTTLSKSPGAYAYVVPDIAGDPTGVEGYYQPRLQRSTGGPIEILVAGPGYFVVRLRGIGSIFDGGNIQVTALDGRAVCSPIHRYDLPGDPSSQEIHVVCAAPGGYATESRFALTFTRDRNILGTSEGRYAYLNSNLGFNTRFNSTGGLVDAVPNSTGSDNWQFQFPGTPDAGPYLVLATPIGAVGAACPTLSFALTAGNPSELRGRTQCFGNQNSGSTSTDLVFLSTRSMADAPADVTTGELDLPLGTISIGGVNVGSLIPASARFSFDLNLAALEYREAPTVTVNGIAVPSTQLVRTARQIFVSSALRPGRNDVQLSATVSNGDRANFAATLWAGDATLRVSVVDTAGRLVQDNISVRVGPVVDQSVYVESVINGTADFRNVPPTTVMIEATGPGLLGTATVAGISGSAQVVVSGIGTPSTIDNDDFSKGLAGYDVGTAPVALIEHVEGPYAPVNTTGIPRGPNAPPDPSGVTVDTSPSADTSSALTAGASARPASAEAMAAMGVAAPSPASVQAAAQAPSAGDVDLALTTRGRGPQSITRVLRVAAGTTDVRLRYRFMTLEVPFGYFGTQFDDAFSVSIRSSRASRGETNSMNGLGLAQFDYRSGSTAWRDVTVPVNPDGDVVQIQLSVSNVGDAWFDSSVIVDVIQQTTEILNPALRWDPAQGGMELSVTVDGVLRFDRTVDIYYARGTTFESRLGNPITRVTIAAGASGTVKANVPGPFLANDPDGTTHLIAVVSPSRVGFLEDVKAEFQTSATRHPADRNLVNIIKDGLRAAGQAKARITSAFRRPEDQARIMFEVLSSKADLQMSIAQQMGLYMPPGQAVVKVFATLAQGKTQAQVLAMAATIKQAMLDEINRQGCVSVSKHCVDPSIRVTLDVGARELLLAGNFQRYVNAVRPRVNNFLDETCISNNAYHQELATIPGNDAPQSTSKCTTR